MLMTTMMILVVGSVVYGATGVKTLSMSEIPTNWNSLINTLLIGITVWLAKREFDDIKEQAYLAKDIALKVSEDAKELALKTSDDAKATALRVTEDTKATALRVSSDAKETALRGSAEAKETALRVGKDLGDKIDKVASTHSLMIDRLSSVETKQLESIKLGEEAKQIALETCSEWNKGHTEVLTRLSTVEARQGLIMNRVFNGNLPVEKETKPKK
jgi:hypothetical protein